MSFINRITTVPLNWACHSMKSLKQCRLRVFLYVYVFEYTTINIYTALCWLT